MRATHNEIGDVEMSQTLIQKYATSLVRDFMVRAADLKDLVHDLTKGELRELFVSRVLRSFLTSQFGIGSGIILNRKGQQSNQMDVVIYDNRIILPFIHEQNIGVYPAESVIATIEVKTTLDGPALKQAEETAKKLTGEVFAGVEFGFQPLCAAFGFEGGFDGGEQQEKGAGWLAENAKHLFDICVAGKYSWANVGGKGWTLGTDTSGVCDETKRFISLLLDNTRTYAQERFRYFVGEGHWDWISAYIRG
jgi:hypothetical protein